MNAASDVLEVNGRSYRAPAAPVVVVCIDGSEADYHEQAIAAGLMPYLAELPEHGTSLVGECTMPSFTNPNNISIATGVPPAVHGICGNYFYDAESDSEVMMNDPRYLRAPTIFAEFERIGAKVAVVTAKDKLRRLLGEGLEKGVCFSAEHADRATTADNGITDVLDLVGRPLPSVYSADLSEFVMAAGVALLERDRPDLMYLSLTDFIQHKHAPGSPVANDFYAMLDRYFKRLDELGAVLVITADHGMNAKTAGGAPNVVYLDELAGPGGRVVLPITDPYTVHHGALGSFATVHLPADADVPAIAGRIAGVPGVQQVLRREEACEAFELPADRIGELVVIGDRNTALGTSPDRHDLTQLDGHLRSHGGLTEQEVPFLINRPVQVPDGHRLRNFDAYWVALNLGRQDR
ncbi:phosphonoacetate hydrolase [Saccharopolyspora sp. WRP15-2]|uniref:Phosphonoacetate hydrolase n=1 Tax=Saccharopolyspora oryzae TaxID=2997343 RepID=A0ABT4URT8_9PSEU|nr:phosphonoacetate hydrolase [Saccharopolyspora oryzae]MDA3624435.1 phosphonoacetate hydrolase [Saccharopolyspora oryzae]